MLKDRKLLFIIVAVLAVAIVFLISGNLSAPEPVKTSMPFTDGETVSLQGELVCLPHTDQSGPQTMECAYGFRDSTGSYYAVKDTTEEYSLIMSIPMNEPMTIEGTYRFNPDTKYQQVGSIEATAISR